ncbi:MAG: hypothetical protein ACK4VI_04600 [Alphaproteobacteria bacterium]
MGVVLDQRGFMSGRRRNSPAANVPIALAILMLMLALGAGKAWAHDAKYNGVSVTAQDHYTNQYIHKASLHSQGQQQQIEKNSKISPVSAVADACHPLMKAFRHPPAADVTDRSAQRNAGHIAALGLVMGMRYALEPPSTSSQSAVPLRVQGHPSQSNGGAIAQRSQNDKAHAIIQYRRCMKEQALVSSALQHASASP